MTSERFEPFLHQLRLDLAQPLPGPAAQLRMAPRLREIGENERYDRPRSDARRGAVLLLFYPWQDDIHLPLILRPEYSGVHSGQVGLPGGGYEAIDADLTATALREAHEEIGVSPSQLTVYGSLSPLYVYASNYLVQPVVAWSPMRPKFHPDPYEVAELLEVTLAALIDPASRREEDWQLRGRHAVVPFFSLAGQVVWGATAMILSELLALPSLQQTVRSFDSTA